MKSYDEFIIEIDRAQFLDAFGKSVYKQYADAHNEPEYEEVLQEMADALKEYRLKKNTLDVVFYEEVKKYLHEAEARLDADTEKTPEEKEELKKGIEKIRDLYKSLYIYDVE